MRLLALGRIFGGWTDLWVAFPDGVTKYVKYFNEPMERDGRPIMEPENQPPMFGEEPEDDLPLCQWCNEPFDPETGEGDYCGRFFVTAERLDSE